MQIQPYLFFEGRCEEAIDFYQRALGAEVVMTMRYEESPDPPPEGFLPAGSEHKIMHAAFKVGDALVMVSDGMCSGKTSFDGFSLALTVPDAATADRMFAALADGGKVEMPLGETFWSPRFGMLADRFGVGWMLIVEAPEEAAKRAAGEGGRP
jgi:PhnB protein